MLKARAKLALSLTRTNNTKTATKKIRLRQIFFLQIRYSTVNRTTTTIRCWYWVFPCSSFQKKNSESRNRAIRPTIRPSVRQGVPQIRPSVRQIHPKPHTSNLPSARQQPPFDAAIGSFDGKRPIHCQQHNNHHLMLLLAVSAEIVRFTVSNTTTTIWCCYWQFRRWVLLLPLVLSTENGHNWLWPPFRSSFLRAINFWVIEPSW